MGWGKFRDRLIKTGKDATGVTVVEEAAKVVKGDESIGDAAKEVLKAQTRPAGAVAATAADVDRKLQDMTAKIAGKVGGKKAETLVADFNYLARRQGDAALASAAVDSVNAFIDTGDIEYLNPINIYVLREIQDTYEKVRAKSHPIPTDVLAALPDEPRGIAKNYGVTWVLEQEISGDLHLPSFALSSRENAALTLIDVIVFSELPGAEKVDDLFLWTHELKHVLQYKQLGTEKFSIKYISEWMAPRPAGGIPQTLETSADLFACKFFPDGNPSYLPGNRCPPAYT